MNFSWIEQITNNIKIPTLLALACLMIGLVGGVYLTTQKGFLSLKTQADISTIPKNITLSNLSDSSVVIYWQTDKATTGFIQTGPTPDLGQNFKDDRDDKVPLPHTLHFVTISGLTPSTTYYYKITSESQSYPKGDPAVFTTLTHISPQNYPPLMGKILDQKLQPVTEAIIILEIPGAQTLSSITKMAGNFILPMSTIRSNDLLRIFSWNKNGTIATLKVFDNVQSSEIKIFLDSQGNQITSTASALMPIILGKNMDLVPPVKPTASQSPVYDLNNDGKVNSLDTSVILKNFGKNPKNKQADLNKDDTVDQKDVDLMNNFLHQQI